MDTNEKLRILSTYGFVDQLRGFRTTTIDLYSTRNSFRAYLRCSDDTYDEAVNTIYNSLNHVIYLTAIRVWNDNLD